MANRETGARWDTWASIELRGFAYHDALNRSVGHEGLGEVPAQMQHKMHLHRLSESTASGKGLADESRGRLSYRTVSLWEVRLGPRQVPGAAASAPS